MNNLPLLNDLRVFMLVARRAGFAAVAEELKTHPNISEFRLGKYGEGEDGVTIAKLK